MARTSTTSANRPEPVTESMPDPTQGGTDLFIRVPASSEARPVHLYFYRDRQAFRLDTQTAITLIHQWNEGTLPAGSRHGQQSTLVHAQLDYLRTLGVAFMLDPAGHVIATVGVVDRQDRDYRISGTTVHVRTPPITVLSKWNPGNGGHITSSIWVSESIPTRLGDTIECIPWPWGNVYDYGKICWGSTNRQGLHVNDPFCALTLFFSGMGNQDLWRGGAYWDQTPSDTTRPLTLPANIRTTPFGQVVTNFLNGNGA